MRSAYRRTSTPFLGAWKPLFIVCFGLFGAWLLSSAGLTGDSLRLVWQEQLSGKAAAAALSWEWGTADPGTPDGISLLRFASPLLAGMTAKTEEETAETKTENPATIPRSTPEQSAPAETEIPLLVPMLPIPEETPAETESPAETAAVDIPEGDDRSWPTPGADTPGANPVKEVTLLPSHGGENPGSAAVTVNNDTKYSLDIPGLLSAASVLKPSAEGEPQILLIHTHGSESFLPDARAYYIPTDIERTEDTRYNVVRLGDEMTERLEALGLTVLHDRDIHDYPTYNGSYNRAYTCIVEYIKDYPSIQMVIDIHRDSISSADGSIMYKAVSQTEQGKAAQMMFVIGSNGSGLNHDNWRGNLSLAAKLQERLLTAYPTLMRPIHLRTERFNQHATPGSMILEVGTAANALDEALLSIKLFCDTVGPWLAEELLG